MNLNIVALSLSFVATSILLSACAALDNVVNLGTSSDPVSLKVTSAPTGSTIFVNGENKGTAPLLLALEAKKKFVGILVEPGGWRYENNFYFIEAAPPAGGQSRYANDSIYINPREVDGSNGLHFDLSMSPTSASERQEGSGKIIGIKDSILPTFKSTGYVRILQINGQPLDKWNGSPYAVELPVGNYSIATMCNWDLGIRGEAKIANIWPIKITIEPGRTYQLETVQTPGNRCKVLVVDK